MQCCQICGIFLNNFNLFVSSLGMVLIIIIVIRTYQIASNYLSVAAPNSWKKTIIYPRRDVASYVKFSSNEKKKYYNLNL